MPGKLVNNAVCAPVERRVRVHKGGSEGCASLRRIPGWSVDAGLIVLRRRLSRTRIGNRATWPTFMHSNVQI